MEDAMKTVQARLISSTIKKGKTIRAQVVVLIGEGPNRRSVTCHVEHKGGIWVGRNPDESAEGYHEAADNRVSGAESAVQKVVKTLATLRAIAEGKKTKEAPDGFFTRLLKRGVALAIESEESNLRLAEEDLKNAERRKEEVEREYPLYVEFVF